MAAALDALRSTLEAIPAGDVRSPDQPIEVYFQETEDVMEHVAQHDLAQRMVDEGLDQATLDALPQALDAGREAQTEWTLTNDREKPQDQRTLERQGYSLRTSVAKKLRFSLRKDKAALNVLGQILDGEGVPDLVQDLDDLAKLIADNSAPLARNRNFDSAKVKGELTELAENIRAGLAGFRMSAAMVKAVDLRNRAWTHLDGLVDDVREAGRAVSDGAVERGFGSAYERRQRAAQRRKAKSETPQET